MMQGGLEHAVRTLAGEAAAARARWSISFCRSASESVLVSRDEVLSIASHRIEHDDLASSLRQQQS